MAPNRTDAAAFLTAELETALLRQVRRAYSELNGTFFRHALRRPMFELSDAEGRLGRWDGETRTLELSRSLFIEHGWGTVVEVLKHEMAHQYVDEVLGAAGESAHGPAFRRVCEERGIDGRAAGMPRPADGESSADAAVLERIAKLLALAESPNEHEAAAAMKAAQRLMLKYNLDAVSSRRQPAYSFRHLGKPTGRVSEHQRILALILSEHFFVDVIWVSAWRPLEGKRGSVLEICGSVPNLEMAEYVHSFLSHTAEALWREHKRAQGVRGNKDRRAYLAGVMAGFREQLDAQRRDHGRTGLVWKGDPQLGEYFRRRHPHIRWTRHASSRSSAAHAEGRQAGRRIVLHRGVSSGPSEGARLLTGKRA